MHAKGSSKSVPTNEMQHSRFCVRFVVDFCSVATTISLSDTGLRHRSRELIKCLLRVEKFETFACIGYVITSPLSCFNSTDTRTQLVSVVSYKALELYLDGISN